jgi:hypothetical protein
MRTGKTPQNIKNAPKFTAPKQNNATASETQKKEHKKREQTKKSIKNNTNHTNNTAPKITPATN